MAQRGRQLVTCREAQQAKGQHTKPCSDCPWARTALNGWLGSMTADEWVHVAHTDSLVECHTLLGAQCAGLAIYRRNVAKFVHPPLLRLEANRELVFSSPMEFKDHHSKMPEIPVPKKTKKTASKKTEPSLKDKLADINTSDPDEAFGQAAQIMSEYLCTIRCSPEDYRAGLRSVIEQLQLDIRASEETS